MVYVPEHLSPGPAYLGKSPSDEQDELDVMDADDDDEEVELSKEENAIKMALVDHAIMLKRCLTSFARSSNPILKKGFEDLYKRKF